MDATGIVLSLGLLGAVATVVWLLIQRGQHAAALAARTAERDAAEAMLTTTRTELASERAQRAEADARVLALEKQSASTLERLASAEQANRDLRSEMARRVQEAEDRAHELAQIKLDAALAERDAAKKLVADAQATMRDAFGSLSKDALKANADQFLTLAQQRLGASLSEGTAAVKQQRDAVETLIKPVSETLNATRERLTAIETLTASMGQSNADLRTQTEQLVRALRDPKVRGRYGEIQLRRVMEIAGMREYCDFDAQDTTRDADGNALRPDFIVKLPNGRDIVVDAKANLQPYVEAAEAQDDSARHQACMKRFADGIAAQARDLGSKGYWRNYDGAPDFVVMFVPGDHFVDAALSLRPDLVESAAASRVILASPSSLIALLQVIKVGFREKTLSEHAHTLLALGTELHERAATAMTHIERLGASLKGAVEHYNKFVGSYESRLEPTLRRMEELGVSSGKQLAPPEPVTVIARQLLTAPSAGVGPATGASD